MTYENIKDVHIFTKNKNFAAISNEKGILELPILADSTTLYIQHLSYQEETFSYAKIKAQNFEIQLFPKDVELVEFVVSGKFSERMADVSNRIDIIKAEEIALQNPQSSADMLQNTGNVYVQKSQMGGGSPVIRGFEANKVLIVVDGVRMNNAIFRGGHVQNVITIDNNVLERTEVVFGPGSLLYGSDALGGVMNFMSKNPTLAQGDEKLAFSADAMLRYGYANDEKTANFNFSFANKKFGTLTSITSSDFGDLKIGKKRPHGYEDWGKRPFYVDTFDGVDSLVKNDKEHILRFTKYRQINALQKFYYKPTANTDMTINLQYATSSNIPRFDRLNDVSSNDTLKFAEWYYGPQNRLLTSFQLNNSTINPIYDQFKLVAAYQKIEEDRIDRKFGKTERRHREEEVDVYSWNMDFVKKINDHHTLQYGTEATYNKVNSKAYLEDINLMEISDEKIATRYPDGGSSMTTAAAYVRHKWQVNDKLTIIDGFRYSLVGLQASFIDTSFYSLPYTSANDFFSAFTGSLGMTYRPFRHTKIATTLATGFRSPNIDDATKVFDPTETTVVVPNVDLVPEYAYNADLNVQQKINQLDLQADFYYTYLTNVIKRTTFNLNGQDSLVYDGELKAIYANVNSGKAYVAGMALSANYAITPQLSLTKKWNFTKGYDISAAVPLGHIPPMFGLAALNYKNEKRKLNASLQLRYNAWKRIENYGGYSCTK